jgi:Protein of unknown function (DUF1552)
LALEAGTLVAMKHPMVMIKRRWSRRDFFRAAGIFGGAAALSAILPELGDARAQSTAPKRLLLVNTGNGTVMPKWRQAGLVHGRPLPGLTSPLLAPLEAYRERMVFVDGLDMAAAYDDDLTEASIIGHPAAAGAAGHPAIHVLWTGRNGGGQFIDGPGNNDMVLPNGPSVDQAIAAEIGAQSALGSLQLSNWKRGDTAFDLNGTPLVNEFDLPTAFSKVFGGVVVDESALERKKARRVRSLDHLRGEIQRLRGELPSEDRDRLDTHLAHFDALEARIQSEVACTVPPAPTAGLQAQAHVDTMHQLIQQAFACDRTRVINYSLMSDNDFGPDSIISFIDGVTTQYGGPHALSHASEDLQAAADMQTQLCIWQSEMFADLLGRLDAVPDGPGQTMLDTTVVVWGQHMSHGGTHLSRATPAVIVTGANGPFQTNQYLRFGDYNPDDLGKNGNGQDYSPMFQCEANNRLLVSLCQAFGMSVDTFGDTRFSGPLPGLEVV